MREIFIVFVFVTFIGTITYPLFKEHSYTTEEREEFRAMCEMNGQVMRIDMNGNKRLYCSTPENPVFDCIDKYVDSVDEKYNNPDTVSGLSEDGYSTVVKTCKETFGKK